MPQCAILPYNIDMRNKKPKALKAKRVPIKNGLGEIKGYITMLYSTALGWVSIPSEEI